MMTEEHCTIFQRVLSDQAPEIIVDEWIDSYKGDKKQALINLLQFLFDSSGCKGKVGEINNDYTALIRNLTTEFNEDASDYPICRLGIKWKRFRSGFSDFLNLIMKRCQNSIIYDGYLMTNLTSLLASLSDSQVRAFRHTSTYATMKLMTALINVLVFMSSKHSMSRRQYIYETKKSPERRASAKIEYLISLVKEEEENIDILNELIKFLFKAVFVNRFRDVVPAIREICISEMGVWMKKAPEKFLDDLHLKYIGWSLSDKVGGVRIRAIQALWPLYETGKHTTQLELFTLNFKDRIVSMTRDVDTKVVVEAIKLIQEIFKCFQTAFDDDDIEQILKLIYCSASNVAQTAGIFFTTKLEFEIRSLIFLDQNPTESYINMLFIKQVMRFHLDCGLHKHASYLVNSLITNAKAMKDWKSMTDLLLGQDQRTESLTPDEEKLLVEIIVCSVSQTSTKIPPIGRQVENNLSLKVLKQAENDIQRIGTYFIAALPSLLGKYCGDTDVLGYLLEIPQYLDLNILSFYPSSANLESILFEITNIVKIYHDYNILDKCCKNLENLCNVKHRISLKAKTCKNMIIDDMVNKYRISLSDCSQAIDKIDADIKFSLADNLLKISVFYSVFDLVSWDLWDDLFNFLNEAIKSTIPLPEECVKNCMLSCYYSILWDLKSYEDKVENNIECSMDSKFKLRIFPYIDLLKRLIVHSVSKIWSEESYTIFCDLLVIMKNSLKTLRLPSIVMANTQKILQAFVERRVFYKTEIDDFEESIEHLHNLRVMLSSYCKLYLFGILPVYFITHLIKHYITSFSDFGDILNATIIGTKNIDNVDWARAILSALLMIFEESVDKIIFENNSYLLENIGDIKELAKQLSSFMVSNDRKEMISEYTLHKEAISFGLRNSDVYNNESYEISHNILFFDILIEFSYKLSHSVKCNILKYLNSQFDFNSSIDYNQFKPLLSYRNSLLTHKKGKR